MKIKEGIQLLGVVPQMLGPAFMAVYDQCVLFTVDCVITSGVEGKHKRSSAHSTGRALDFRTRDLVSQEQKELFRDNVARDLGSEYDVILQSNHLHVEWDPKKGVNL